MKLTSLLLSSAAVLVAGSAFAADLPAKKAAPAAAVVACPAFGAGFFQLPGSDNCLKIGGYVRHASTYQSAADRNVALTTSALDRYYAPFSQAASYDIQFDIRSNSDIGVIRGYAETDSGSIYVQAGGFTFGFAGHFLGTAGGYVTPSLGSHSNGTQINYSAALGAGSTLTIAVVDPDANDYDGAASSRPDIQAVFKTSMGPVAVGLGAVSHEALGTTSGSVSGYAVAATVAVTPTAGTTFGVDVGYADGAIGYLGNEDSAVAVNGAYTQVKDTDATSSTSSSGYVVNGYVKQALGKGTLQLYVTTLDISGVTTATDTQFTAYEVSYAHTLAKGLTITPAVSFQQASVNNVDTDTTVGYLRIERDF